MKAPRWLRSWLGIGRPTLVLLAQDGAFKVLRYHHQIHVTGGEPIDCYMPVSDWIGLSKVRDALTRTGGL